MSDMFLKDSTEPYKAPRDWYAFRQALMFTGIVLLMFSFVGGVIWYGQERDHHTQVQFTNMCRDLKGTIFITDDAFQCVVGKTLITQNR